MNEISRPLQQIESEIDFYKGQFANNTIEIGKRLIEAKQQLQHGEWGKWLEEKVNFSQETARKFMKVSDEFSNSNTSWNLSKSKIFALLDVPSEEREAFISESHEIGGQSKTVEEMTTRELERVIKEKKAAEENARKFKEDNQLLKENNEMLQLNSQIAIKQAERFKTDLEKDRLLIETLQTKLNEKVEVKEIEVIKEVEVITEVVPADYESFKNKAEKFGEGYRQSLEKIKDQEEEIEAYKDSLKVNRLGLTIDITDIDEYRYIVNTFLKSSSVIVYSGDAFKEMPALEKDKWWTLINQVERFLEDWKSALLGNVIGANITFERED